jgi:hypothetical protein
MKNIIEDTLNLFPEVAWDRFAGETESEIEIGVFGWVQQDDGKADFVYLRIDEGGAWLISTSSAKYSEEFARRCSFDGHKPCKRVEEYFPNVKAVKLCKL